MTTFNQNLSALPSIDDITALVVVKDNQPIAMIENKPGQAGSLAVYAFLAQKYGAINAAAAEEGLLIYAEHTADARANPGKHPNIDRLIALVGTPASYMVGVQRT